jgi:DNA modification methylase
VNYLNQCHFGDVRAVLRQMIADGVKVNTIVTSPPYWGLRSYLPEGHADKGSEIGSEPTLKEFIETMTGVMMLAREVLANDGTMWMNMGDSYAGSWGSQGRDYSGVGVSNLSARQVAASQRKASQTGTVRDQGMKPKDLMGQPWRLAFALQDAGWWLRQDIIWSKPNPMPESTRDRCTKAHEYLFLLAKSERYYYDFDAVQEPVNGGANARRAGPNAMRGQTVPSGWDTRTGEGGHGAFHKLGRTPGTGVGFGHGFDKEPKPRVTARKLADAGSGTKNNESMDAALEEMRSTRNRRSVWTVGTEPYKGAHFATFPTKLITHCILAGAPAGGTVLDIFMGSGTTAQVAERLGRQWIGIDIDVRNKTLQDERLRQPSLNLEAA